MASETLVDPLVAARARALAALCAGDLAEAEAAIDEISRLVFEERRVDAEAWAHLLRARVAVARGDMEDAGRLATRTCAEFLAIGPTPAAAFGLASLARLLDELRRSDEAVEALAISALITDQLTDTSTTLVEACAELAAVFAELEVFESAHRYAERAYVVTLAMDDHGATIDRCLALTRQACAIADALTTSGEADAAIDYRTRAEQAARLGLGLVDRHDGSPAQRRGLELALGLALATPARADDALPLLTAALEAATDDADQAAAVEGLGRVRAAQGDHIRAIEHLTQAAAQWTALGERDRAAAALHDLALSQAVVGRTNAAFASLRSFVDADQARQASRRRRFAEVIGDRLTVITDERALVRRARDLTWDPVTGLADRRHLEGAIDELGKRWAGLDVGLVVLDVDNLPSVRVRYSDDVADEVLRRLGAVLRGQQRDDDVAARWSDDTFLVLLPRCPVGATEAVATRLRQAAAAVAWADVAFGLSVSVSIGTAATTAPFDLGALVMEAGASLAVTRATRAAGA